MRSSAVLHRHCYCRRRCKSVTVAACRLHRAWFCWHRRPLLSNATSLSCWI